MSSLLFVMPRIESFLFMSSPFLKKNTRTIMFSFVLKFTVRTMANISGVPESWALLPKQLQSLHGIWRANIDSGQVTSVGYVIVLQVPPAGCCCVVVVVVVVLVVVLAAGAAVRPYCWHPMVPMDVTAMACKREGGGDRGGDSNRRPESGGDILNRLAASIGRLPPTTHWLTTHTHTHNHTTAGDDFSF